MIALSLTLDKDGALSALSAVRERIVNRKPALRSIARAGVASTRRRFQFGRGPDGSAWKKGKKKTGKTLILSTLLLRSISDRPPTEDSVEWGSNRAYAAVHQDGFNGQVQVSSFTRVVRKIFGLVLKVPATQTVRAHSRTANTPARPYLGVNVDDERKFAEILLAHVGQPLGGPGL